ncbi:hypothetical protein SAMN04487964_11224 [Marinobacterium sediminicola]|uniref:Uncharacterized protein n=1 Tax=Marinobacterium sediminicola TaxID=518898 RepID=A0ABY1S2L8_9GAMM|nr:hypothetical protein SAMN04487964_11224 [Marinobacterium sediminicola]
MAKAPQTRLSDYLEKVVAGKPVNYSVFEKLLELFCITSRQRRTVWCRAGRPNQANKPDSHYQKALTPDSGLPAIQFQKSDSR